MSERVAVVGGTGKTGRAVVTALTARAAEAVPLGRAAWIDLAGALDGCAAAYVIAPNMHHDEAAYVERVVDAARRSGVSRVVLHSVASPYVPAMPHHVGKAAAEDVVRRSGLGWTILQPGAYVQNFPADATVRLAYRASAPFGFADLDDVADVAARVLVEDGHDGATYELASFAATAGELVTSLGSTVEQVSPEVWAATEGRALEPRVRDWLQQMFAYYDRYGLPVGTRPMRFLLDRAPRVLVGA
ncbi:SDR family oxidoreductase [Nocardioides sp. MAHUQ-72]|uniref:SDR family oxidoreductase n=1 Tax=unclassified Nocardioides TaxID=2615069 RepID=UPI00361F6BD7